MQRELPASLFMTRKRSESLVGLRQMCSTVSCYT
jgi:hypothetical protein